MRTVTLYTRPGCHLCEEARAALEAVRAELSFALVELDIDAREELQRAYFERIPVVCLDDHELFEYFVDADVLRERLRAAGQP
jgi:glutaredoxin